jgi:hypothetical protein
MRECVPFLNMTKRIRFALTVVRRWNGVLFASVIQQPVVKNMERVCVVKQLKYRKMIANIKIWIGKNNEEYSRLVQEQLFSYGLTWNSGDRTFLNTDMPVLCVGFGTNQRISCNGLSREGFEILTQKEMKLVSVYSLEEVKDREKITIGDKSYYLDELEVALKNIKPIENV